MALLFYTRVLLTELEEERIEPDRIWIYSNND